MGTLTAIALLPLLGFLLNGLLGPRLGKRFVSVVGCGLPALAFLVTVKVVLDLKGGGWAPISETAYTWAQVGTDAFRVAFWFDRLTAVMALIVTGVGTLIHVYSTGYMHEDKGYARYFAYLNLFLFFMLLLVLGRSLLVLFVGWEGVGLASYLLIGFWFEDAEKAKAGKKAFIVNRIGDAGFLLGMFVLYAGLGTLDMPAINAAFANGTAAGVSATSATCSPCAARARVRATSTSPAASASAAASHPARQARSRRSSARARAARATSSSPRARKPVPASSTMREPLPTISTQAVLPPTSTVSGPGLGKLPRTPQKRISSDSSMASSSLGRRSLQRPCRSMRGRAPCGIATTFALSFGCGRKKGRRDAPVWSGCACGLHQGGA